MHTISVKGGKRDLGRFVTPQVDPHLAIIVTHDQLAAIGLRRQRHHKCRKHARRLLGVAMADEKAALVVDQQLVEFGRHLPMNAQPFGSTRHNAIERLGPMLATDGDAARLDLPGAADIRIDDGVRAAPERSPCRGLDQLLGLLRQQRQRNQSDAIDIDTWRQEFGQAGDDVIAGAVHVREDFGQFLSDGHPATCLTPVNCTVPAAILGAGSFTPNASITHLPPQSHTGEHSHAVVDVVVEDPPRQAKPGK